MTPEAHSIGLGLPGVPSTMAPRPPAEVCVCTCSARLHFEWTGEGDKGCAYCGPKKCKAWRPAGVGLAPDIELGDLGPLEDTKGTV